MGVPVGELQRRITGREFREWLAYDRINPIGTVDRLESMLATLTALTYNVWRGRGQATRKPEDFLPRWRKKQRTPEEQEMAMQVWARLHNEGIRRRQSGRSG